ncbi:MAG: response regulator, partial [Clostridia bacterium]
MYRVFLADDEPWILEGLRACIDWETLGFTLCGTAENGLDALEKIGRLRPDCLLADIRMPGMDGLTLIARAREENPRLRCAILSGYAEFTYAREGIRQGVDGYLLKPIEETDLEALLHIMRSKLDMPLLLPTVADTPDPLEAVRQYVD